jgi:hypothetical protein
MVTQRQIRAIHALTRKIGLDDDDYRILLGAFKVKSTNKCATSSKDLDFNQANQLISELVKLGIKFGVIQEQENRPGMLTKKQEGMLRQMWASVSILPKKEQRAGFDKFLRNRFGIGCLKWLPKEQVCKVKQALSAMVQQKKETLNVTDNKQTDRTATGTSV